MVFKKIPGFVCGETRRIFEYDNKSFLSETFYYLTQTLQIYVFACSLEIQAGKGWISKQNDKDYEAYHSFINHSLPPG
jgi:hypothetical protein